MNAEERRLLASTDAREWAKAFVSAIQEDHGIIDEETVITWFANAIETGRHAGIRSGG